MASLATKSAESSQTKTSAWAQPGSLPTDAGRDLRPSRLPQKCASRPALHSLESGKGWCWKTADLCSRHFIKFHGTSHAAMPDLHCFCARSCRLQSTLGSVRGLRSHMWSARMLFKVSSLLLQSASTAQQQALMRQEVFKADSGTILILAKRQPTVLFCSRASASRNKRSFLAALSSGRYFISSLKVFWAVFLSMALVNLLSAGGTCRIFQRS